MKLEVSGVVPNVFSIWILFYRIDFDVWFCKVYADCRAP